MESAQKLLQYHISIHALREEGDAAPPQPERVLSYFYPRPPRGGRRAALLGCPLLWFISIHALREEGDGGDDLFQLAHCISIHALREEGDNSQRDTAKAEYIISIHALREEGDSCCMP